MNILNIYISLLGRKNLDKLSEKLRVQDILTWLLN